MNNDNDFTLRNFLFSLVAKRENCMFGVGKLWGLWICGFALNDALREELAIDQWDR